SKGARCNPTKCCRRSTTTTMPPVTWSGTFHYVYTDDEMGTGSTPTEVDTKDDHLRIEGTWTITGTTGGEPPSVNVDSSWMGTYTLMKTATTQRPFCGGNEAPSIMPSTRGSGTGTQQFIIPPTAPDPNQFTVGFIPATPLNVIQLSGGTHRTQCNT